MPNRRLCFYLQMFFVVFICYNKTKYFICNSSNFQDGIEPTKDYLQENFTFLIENGLITINKKIKELYDQTNQQMDKLISGHEINFKKVLESLNIKYVENTNKSLNYTTNEKDKTIINMDNIMNNLDDYMKNKNNFAKEFDEKVLGKKSIKNISSQKILLFLYSCINTKLIIIEYRLDPEFPKNIFF